MIALTPDGQQVELSDAFTFNGIAFIREEGSDFGYCFMPENWELQGAAPELSGQEIRARFLNEDKCFSGDDAFNLFVERLIGRGGAWRKQGRKHLSKSAPTKRITITLTDAQAAKAKRIGNSSASLGVRLALEAYAE